MIRPRQYALLLGFTILPHFTELLSWVWLLSVATVAWALFVDHKPKFKPNRWVVHFLTLLYPTLVYFQFGTLLGPDAATSVLLLMIGLKLFEVYSHRDAIVTLALTLLLAMYHLVFKQDLVTTIYMIIVMIWSFYLLFKLNRPNQAPRPQGLQIQKILGLETLLSIPVLLALFFFFPRFTSPIGRFIEKQNNTVGFSEDLRPGDFANLANSDEVAFRVEFLKGRNLRKDELYFRGQTLEVTDGINWMKSTNRRQFNATPYSDELEGIHYRITFEPRFEKLIFALDQTYAFSVRGAGSRVKYFGNSSIETSRSNQQKFQLQGVLGNVRLQYVNPRQDFTKLPVEFFRNNPRLQKLIEEIRNNHTSPPSQMQAIRDFFSRSNFVYSLDTPQYPTVDQLLFETKLGFCEHFASAATLMARALDISARVVIGFQGGQLNEYGDYLIVRDRHAHAWMEFVNEQGEWERFDPTSLISGYRIAQGLTLTDLQEQSEGNQTLLAMTSKIWNWMDNLNNNFALALLEMDRGTQVEWLKKLGIQAPNRRTLWKVFLMLMGGIVALVLFVLWIRRPRQNEVQLLRLELIEKLSNLKIGYSENLGPLETLNLLKEKKPEAQDLQLAVKDYMSLRYEAHPKKEAKEIRRRLSRV